MPLQHLTQEGTLSLDGISLQNTFGAWGIIPNKGRGGLIPLWTDFAVRGQNRILPSVTGVIMYEHRVTETEYDLRLAVTGDVDGQTGLSNTDAVQGLEVNLDYLTTNVILPPGNSTGTRAGVLIKPSGETLTASVQVMYTKVEDYLLQECASLWIAMLHIRLPEGRFS